MKKGILFIGLVFISLQQCRDLPEYPNEPIIDFESFALYVNINALDQEVLTGKIDFSFTDGDGNIGFTPIPDSLAADLPDSVRYNLFFQLHEIQNGNPVLITEEEGGYLKYVIPYLDKQPLAGTVSVTIEYPIIKFDTIFYTFYCYDRDYNRSNVDTTYLRKIDVDF